MIQTLIFDLGNVLLFFDHNKMIKQLAARLSLEAGETREIIFNEDRLHRFEKGEINSHHIYEELKAHCSTPCSFEEMAFAASDIFTPNMPLIAALDCIKRQNIRLVLLSNTVDMHIEFVRKRFNILDHFDHLILSYEVGCRKPEPAIYKKALRAAECPKESTLFIDDMQENIDAALAVGIPSYHFVDTQAFLTYLKNKQLVPHV